MIFNRVDVFLFFVFFICENRLIKAQQCKVCQARDFNTKSQPCICSGDYFCNITNHECTKCDQCYDHWNNVIKDRKGDVENILKKLIKRYEVNLSELKNLLETLDAIVNNRENELKEINTNTSQAGKKISEVTDDNKALKEDINEVEELLKKIGNLQSVEELVKYLTTVKDMMKSIQEKLNKLNFDIDDVELLDIDKFKNISYHVNNMNKNFPVLEKTSLNLALSLESDIDLLESIILTFRGNNTNAAEFNNNINEKTEWIENDLLWLFTVLNNYENVSIDTNGLVKTASNVRSSAVNIDSTLTELLQKHEDFDKYLQELKSETQFYKDLQELQKRLEKLNADVESYKRLFQMFRRKQDLYNQLESFKTERDAFDKKENQLSKHREELDELLREEMLLLKKLKKLENLDVIKSLDEVLTDIEAMIEETQQIEKDVAAHCSSSLSAKTSE